MLLTGLSAAGKTTLAVVLEEFLEREVDLKVVRIDGDDVREGLCKGLGFSREDRIENLRRIGEVAKMFVDRGCVVIISVIAPYEEARQMMRKMVPDSFIEVFVDTPLEVCKQRDPKGLYAKAIAGKIPSFTGISDPYEVPTCPDVTVSGAGDISEAVQYIWYTLIEKNML